MNVICATNNFGLGPAGTISSIVNGTNDINWYCCGNIFDLSVFKENIFKGYCWSKNKEEICEFVKNNKIELAVVVLDGDIANLLLEIGLKVIFIDCIPFIWTDVEIEEGFLPLKSTVYCAQKYQYIPDSAKKVLNQVQNLKWINPIVPLKIDEIEIDFSDYVLINLGGMHSMIGNGKDYAERILIPLINVLNRKKYNNIIITCGTEAQNNVKEIINNIKGNMNIIVDTFQQNIFLNLVKKSNLFFTSPGSTTMFETSALNKETILLPPQNLSQFYDLKNMQGVIKKVKMLNWNIKELSLEYLSKYLNKGELYVVDLIYQKIRDLKKIGFEKEFETEIEKILKADYMIYTDKAIEYSNSNGTQQIIEIINNFR